MSYICVSLVNYMRYVMESQKVITLQAIRDNNLKIEEELVWLNKMLAKAEFRASMALQEVEQYKIVIDIIESEKNK